MAVHYWTDIMSRDVDKAAEAHREALLNEELKNFMNHVMNRPKGASIKAPPKRGVDARTKAKAQVKSGLYAMLGLS